MLFRSSYRIYRSTQRAEGYTEIGTSESTTFTDTTAENEVPYFYTVAAVGQDNESNPSAPVSIMATAGHTGEYMFGSQAAQMTVLEKSNDTVTGNEAALKFAYDEAGKVSVYAGDRLLSEKETAAGKISMRAIIKNINWRLPSFLYSGRAGMYQHSQSEGAAWHRR